MRVGIGYDIHKLVEGRSLILGGIEVPYELGLEGHSDADVLVHALCDALLGAAGEGDIGRHFPPGDDRYRNIYSMLLLEKVNGIISSRYSISNIDCIIVAQKPRLAPYIEEMRASLSSCLGLEYGRVNIKATTTEGLGVIGEGKAIAAYAVVCLEEL
jgi:2-C-methyl-D-erythritol 2,4-cyclodiphosphate synthase